MCWRQRSFIDADGSCGICHLARSESQMSGKYPQREAAEILTELWQKYLQRCGRNTYRAVEEIQSRGRNTHRAAAENLFVEASFK